MSDYLPFSLDVVKIIIQYSVKSSCYLCGNRFHEHSDIEMELCPRCYNEHKRLHYCEIHRPGLIRDCSLYDYKTYKFIYCFYYRYSEVKNYISLNRDIVDKEGRPYPLDYRGNPYPPTLNMIFNISTGKWNIRLHRNNLYNY
tara:strand:- start:62 stop:487 length:426 start_codon:yes stop_codon:yes gene_type:complete